MLAIVVSEKWFYLHFPDDWKNWVPFHACWVFGYFFQWIFLFADLKNTFISVYETQNSPILCI